MVKSVHVLRRYLAGLIFALSLAGAAPAQDAMAAAFEAMRQGDWDRASAFAAPLGPVAQDIVEWHRLRDGFGSFRAYQRFLQRRPDWPGLDLLARRGEAAIPDDAPPAAVRAYFADRSPQTGSGAARLIAAFAADGMVGDAEAEAVLIWRSFSLGASTEAALQDGYADLLRDHHVARLDMLLWRGLRGEAERQFSRVPTGWQALAKARLALRENLNGVDDLIAAVPAALAKDPGLAYERFLWRVRRNRDDAAGDLLLERSTSAAALGEPARWAAQRRTLAREAMRAGDADRAYRMASTHYLTEGSDYADLEWLSGYLALRYLADPERALDHFQRFQSAVQTPISLGRAGYWLGRAHEALGDTEAAQAAYAEGGVHQTSFYGLLAAERAGLTMDPDLTGAGPGPDWTGAGFGKSSVFVAAQLLRDAGQSALAVRFLRQLAEGLAPEELVKLAAYTLSVNDPHLAVMVAKQSAEAGVVVPRAYYPLADLTGAALPVPQELALSIARRESEFNPVVVSHAGARGLMQLMPGTAQAMATKLALDYSRDKLTSDPAYNAALGSAYLAQLIEEFGHAYVLVAAGYNAGPGRPRRWMTQLGDPRDESIDAVDWIEHIPFDETRNYVMRVMESLPVYRARLSGKTAPLRLSQELKGR